MVNLRSLFGASLCATLAVVLLAQSAADTATRQVDPSVYEDDEVRISIPTGWVRATGNYPSLEPYRVNGSAVVGNSALQANGRLLLQRDGFTLALAYNTGHGSGVEGGRFIEAFDIPWLNPDKAWGECSAAITYMAQPATRTLLFQNMVMNTGVPDVQTKCGIPKDLGRWVGSDLEKRFVGERRWYGGYFSPGRGYLFDESERCGSKLYSLTTGAKTPSELPAAEDPHLDQIIQQAIDIVGSIHYKRCEPVPSSSVR